MELAKDDNFPPIAYEKKSDGGQLFFFAHLQVVHSIYELLEG